MQGSSKPEKTLIIIHAQPIEVYPPVLNIINAIKENNSWEKVYIITTKTSIKIKRPFQAKSGNITIITLGEFQINSNVLKRLYNYFFFYTACFVHLLLKNPDRILFIETLSSLPAYLYKRFIKRTVKIFIHYHEYTSPREYQEGMALARIFHSRERYLYPMADWVSHTNKERMEKFEQDVAPVKISNPHILPNYPPRKWSRTAQTIHKDGPIAFIYVGAVGMETMYIKEFAFWVEARQGAVIWDIYSQQDTSELAAFLLSIKARYIKLKGIINYYELPAVLANYNIGVILYKGHIPNYIYNAPNKLFEYLASELDVWFPAKMQGCEPYLTKGTYPKVIAVDFENLQTENTDSFISHQGLVFSPSVYYAENVLPELLQCMN